MNAGLLGVVALAGGFGAAARCVIDHALARLGPLPMGTWAVNTAGAVGAGLLLGLGRAGLVAPGVALVVGAGFLGSFTTFSSWAHEGVRLLARGRHAGAAAHMAGQAGVGLAAAAIGLALGLAI